MSFAATWMDLEIIILSEETQKDRYYMISLTYEIYFKKITNTNEFTHKTETHTQKTSL